MNGPEHYREAENCLERARSADFDHAAFLHHEAQVHATLALAAATAHAAAGIPEDGDTSAAWRKSIIRPKAASRGAGQ